MKPLLSEARIQFEPSRSMEPFVEGSKRKCHDKIGFRLAPIWMPHCGRTHFPNRRECLQFRGRRMLVLIATPVI